MFYEQYIKACKYEKEKPTVILEELGIPTSNIGNWKSRGTIPKGDIVIKIANRLGLPPEFFTGEEEVEEFKKTEKEKAVQETASEMDDLTDEERKEVIKYIEYIKSKRK